MVRNLSNEGLWNRIYDRFDNEVCRNCCEHILSFRDMSKPQPIPYIGPNFYKDERRLMFVGIETYCNWPPRKGRSKTGYCEFGTAQVERLFFRKSPEVSGIEYSPFWEWVRIISTEVLSHNKNHVEAFTRIAYSNLHKCQSKRKGSTRDDFCRSSYQITEELSRNCIQKAGWIYREIDEIKAKNIIIFSGRKNQGLLARLFLGDDEGRLLKKFDYGNYDLPPSQREKRKSRDIFVHLRDGARRFIVTNHPQGTPSEIRNEIVRIIKEDDWGKAEGWRMPFSSLPQSLPTPKPSG